MADVKVTFQLEGADEVSRKLGDIGKQAQKASETVSQMGNKGSDSTGLQKYFDELDRASKELGDKIAKNTADAQAEISKMGDKARENIAESLKGVGEAAQKQVEAVEPLKSKWDDLAEAAKRLAGPVGAAAAAISLLAVKMSLTGLSEAKAFDNLNKQTNISVENLSKLKYVSELTDVSFQGLVQSLSKFQRALTAIEQGGGGTKRKAFAELFGLDPKDKEAVKEFADTFQKLSPDQQLTKLAEALQKIQDINQRLGLQQELGFSNSLAGFFNEDPEKIRKAGEELEKLGGVVKSITAKDADEFENNLTRISTALAGVRTQVTGQLAGDIRGLTDALVYLIKGSQGLKGLGEVLSALGKALLLVGKVIASAVVLLTAGFTDMQRAIGAIMATMALFADGIAHPTKMLDNIKLIGNVWKEFKDQVVTDSAEWKKALSDMWSISKETGALDDAKKKTEDIKNNLKEGAAAAKKMSMSFDDIGSSLQKTGMSDDGGWGLMKTYGSGWQNSAPGGTRKRITDNYIAGQDAAKARAVPDREDWNELLRDVQGFSQQFSQETARMLVNGEKQWSDYFKRIEQMIVEIIINRTIAAPLQKGIEGVLSKAIGALTGQATGGSAPVENTTPAPAPNMVSAAGGGYIPSGYAGLVGENGPEFIAPAQGGRAVIPNDMLSQMGGGAIVVNQVFNGGVTRSDLGVFGAVVKQRTIAALYDARRRGA